MSKKHYIVHLVFYSIIVTSFPTIFIGSTAGFRLSLAQTALKGNAGASIIEEKLVLSEMIIATADL